ncbi:hypothetical protein A2483_02730 [Candidatus Peregrinibacteria bacterium RIFOXYC2_FULL_33_13]|nr:MAG: hypothetical protein UR27_C0010G0020 [Candidatus Peregrinibacteria bacterium GW2011_GWA2_33_10]KKP41209.1 MAG: hypothetical protein UR30_C0001G0056 [Candidatus Peregrinibacteria bacterium GW2011_GWC2_33_13]OGJ49333.1 MAG: hypothetical protein A2229_03180 [Candidatus Peregrinibacteria bacterium RIFOXYA2_FULL_33_7]OGJ54533.1 MAG: hypothetical protein A2483_02730 [Candidatus Peregrinibacteria bacterium RIFOXYC2_FULL_33_13]
MKKLLLILLLTLFFTQTTSADPTLSLNPNFSNLDQPKTIYIDYQKVNDQQLEIKIIANKFTEEIFAAVFDFLYDPKILKYEKYKVGNFFEQSTDPIYLVDNKKNEGRLITGISLKRGDKMITGSGTLIKFLFTLKGNGTQKLSFDKNQIIKMQIKNDPIKDSKWENTFLTIENSEKNNLKTNISGFTTATYFHLLIELGLICILIWLILDKYKKYFKVNEKK